MRRATRIAAGATGVIAATAGVVWLNLFSPYLYEPPAGLEPVDPTAAHEVFVYGTLRYAPVRWLVIGGSVAPRAAVLPGFERRGLDVVPARGASVDGLALAVDVDQLARLDRFERLGVRYGRTRVVLADGSSAWVYRRVADVD